MWWIVLIALVVAAAMMFFTGHPKSAGALIGLALLVLGLTGLPWAIVLFAAGLISCLVLASLKVKDNQRIANEVSELRHRALRALREQQAPAPPPSVPAAWYPDPNNGQLQRYWDGTRWTDNTAPLT